MYASERENDREQAKNVHVRGHTQALTDHYLNSESNNIDLFDSCSMLFNVLFAL